EDEPNPDVRADVFSLAATLYTLLAGHTPFEVRGRSNGALDLIGRIERGLVTPLERDDVPRSLVAVLAKGMASRREDRFATAVEFARALQRVELELNYAPTTIDVPNLIVDDSVRDNAPDDEDATRARGVATIQAQPEAFTPPPSDPHADETQVRGATRVEAQPLAPVPTETVVRKPAVAQPEAAPQASPELPPEPPRSKANRLVLWLAGSAGVLIAVAVAVSLMITGVPAPVETEPAEPGGGGAAVV